MNAYRQNPFANLTPVVQNLLIINVIFFVGNWFLQSAGINLEPYLAAHYFNAPIFRVWQIITYMFMHGGLMHIFFNMLALYMFGPTLEYTMGPKRFLQYYFITGIGALALQMLVQALEVYQVIGTFTVPHGDISPYFATPGYEKLVEIYSPLSGIVGASGAIFGLLVAFGMLYPNVELFIMFIPLPIKAKYAVIGYILLELYSGVAQYAGDSVAHWAHLGGALFGFILIKIWGMQRPNNFY
ncbi:MULTISPECIES: rhomboid family intramembrane serine protease [unclassified Mucilaginibacter]|uniref:rhomboid family intramembrane serine protease n=1 Tax=unclassified Mucilaginibacter TaxID=2617802 RepID=UPI0031F6FC42